MGKNRLELRRMAEAAEKQKKASGKTEGRPTKKRKAAKRKSTPRKTKDRGAQRKRVVWCVFNGSMKEEGRFPYDQKEAAEAKLELLRSKSKKLYFLQPVKEAIGDVAPPVSEIPVPVEEEPEEETAETLDEEEDAPEELEDEEVVDELDEDEEEEEDVSDEEE